MKCLICNGITSKQIKCLLCNHVFCSYNCMESHIIISHNNRIIQNIIDIKNNLNSNINNNIYLEEENKEERETIIQSPYLIPGILNIRRAYDQKYNLNNFIPIIEKGKPKIIGGGSFGQVFLVMNKINKKFYAIKHMEKKILIDKLNNLDGIYKEIYIQSRIDHPNILPILYVNETISDFDLVLEYAAYGSLFYFIRNNISLNEPLSFCLFIQVVNAVYFLHKNNLIHRDIKPENILLFDNNVIKLCDFGWCVKLEEGQQRGTFCGTTEYMSPELVNHEEYSKEIDVWSLGVLLYEMVHGRSPFRPKNDNFNANDVMNNIRMHNLKFKKNVSEECKKLIYNLLEENPEKRLKVEDIFYSGFVKYYENMKFGLPDSYLIEKYKFKLSKFQSQNNIYIDSKNKYNYNKVKCINNSNDICNIFCLDKNKIKLNYNKKENNKSELIPISTSDANIIGKKREKNKTTLCFNSLSNEVNNTNYFYLGKVKSKSNSKTNIKGQENYFHPKKIKSIIIPNYYQDLNNRSKLKVISKENIDYNKYINIEENNEEKNYNNKNGNSNNNKLSYKRKFLMKPLKMNKIPLNTKAHNYIHSQTNALNSNLIKNKKLLVFNKNNTPRNKSKININTENDNNSMNQSKQILINNTNNLGVKKCKSSFSPKIILNINNKIKKVNTRNNLKSHCDIKVINNSEENITNTKNNTNSNTYNNIAYNIFNNKEDKLEQKNKINKIYYAKSLTHLKRKVEKDNIKSLFISSILNNNTLISEKNKNNIKEDNLNNIKKIYTSMARSPQISNINAYNKIFDSNNNNLKKNKRYYFLNDILSPNLSYNFTNNNSYSYHRNNSNNKNHYVNISSGNLNNYKYKYSKKMFSKKKLLKINSPEELKHLKEFKKYQINLNQIYKNESFVKNQFPINTNYYDKYINSLIEYNSNFKQNKKSPTETYKIRKNNTNANNINNNPKIISLKKSELINKEPNRKNLEKNRYNSNSNIISSLKPKIVSIESEINKNNNDSKRLIIKNKTSYNINEQKKQYKILKKIDVNEFLNNIKSCRDKKRILAMNNNINCNTSINNKINTSLNDNNYNDNFENNRNNIKLDFYSQNSLRIKTNKNNNKNSFCSRNYNKVETKNNNISSKNKIQSNIIEHKTLNLDGKKIILKKDRKIIISPITKKYKKDIKIPKGNILKTENINYINRKNGIFNDEQSKFIYKNKIEGYRKEYKFTNNNIIKYN